MNEVTDQGQAEQQLQILGHLHPQENLVRVAGDRVHRCLEGRDLLVVPQRRKNLSIALRSIFLMPSKKVMILGFKLVGAIIRWGPRSWMAEMSWRSSCSVLM